MVPPVLRTVSYTHLDVYKRQEVSNVNENSTIGDFPQWDSMGHLTILSNVEEAFAINFEPEEMMDLEDVHDIIAAVEEKL